MLFEKLLTYNPAPLVSKLREALAIVGVVLVITAAVALNAWYQGAKDQRCLEAGGHMGVIRYYNYFDQWVPEEGCLPPGAKPAANPTSNP